MVQTISCTQFLKACFYWCCCCCGGGAGGAGGEDSSSGGGGSISSSNSTGIIRRLLKSSQPRNACGALTCTASPQQSGVHRFTCFIACFTARLFVLHPSQESLEEHKQCISQLSSQARIINDGLP